MTTIQLNLALNDSISVLEDAQMRQIDRTSLNRLVDITDWRIGGDLMKIMQELNEGAYIHRKAWEYAMCIHGIRRLGGEKSHHRALGVGAGYERPLFYYANNLREMVATDLYDNPDHEGQPAMLTTPEKFAPFEYRREHLTVMRMDGANLEFEDNSFDIAFSLSSIEHFGPRDNQSKAVLEMRRVVRPGGLICLATELILNRTTHDEYMTPDVLQSTILDPMNGCMVGGPLDLRISRSLVENPIDLRNQRHYNISPHLVMTDGHVIWTSIMLFFRVQ